MLVLLLSSFAGTMLVGQNGPLIVGGPSHCEDYDGVYSGDGIGTGYSVNYDNHLPGGGHSFSATYGYECTYSQQGNQLPGGSWPCVSQDIVLWDVGQPVVTEWGSVYGFGDFPGIDVPGGASQNNTGVSQPDAGLTTHAWAAGAINFCAAPGTYPNITYNGSGGWNISPGSPDSCWIARQWTVTGHGTCPAESALYSPITISLHGKSLLTAYTSVKEGVLFPWHKTGPPVQSAWLAPGEDFGFLVLARDEKGQYPKEPPPNWHIAHPYELMGNFAWEPLDKYYGVSREKDLEKWPTSGYTALALFDFPAMGGNGDGWLGPEDEVYNLLRVWVDKCHTGNSDDGCAKLLTMQEANILRIRVKDCQQSSETDQYGNQLRYWCPVIPISVGVSSPTSTDVFLHVAN